MNAIMTEGELLLASIARSMSEDEARNLIGEIIPIMHAEGCDHYVEALSVAIDAMTWFPLKLAPRDGRKVLLAVAPIEKFDLPGFITIGRWVIPAEEFLEQMGKLRRQRFEASGGWWSSSQNGKPFARPVLGWRPEPRFDFTAAGYGGDAVETING